MMLTILLYNVVYISKKKQWLIQQRRANGETIVEKLKPQNVKNSKRFMFGGRSLKSEERSCYLRGGGEKRGRRGEHRQRRSGSVRSYCTEYIFGARFGTA